MAPLILKTRPCYWDIFCRLANETISRFPSCCICQEECLECSCQGRNLPPELEGFDTCGSNGKPSGRLQSETLLWTLQGRSALRGVRHPIFQLSGDFATKQHWHKYAHGLVLFSFAVLLGRSVRIAVEMPSTLGSVQCQAGGDKNRGLITEVNRGHMQNHGQPFEYTVSRESSAEKRDIVGKNWNGCWVQCFPA